MGFGIFKKIKNGSKSVAGRLKKKALIETNSFSFDAPKKSTWGNTGWGTSDDFAQKWKSRKINSEFPDLRFK